MKSIKLIILLSLTTHILSAQTSYYYYQGKKIFLTERNDKMLLVLKKDANKGGLLKTIKADPFLEITTKKKNVDDINSFIVLSSKDKKNIDYSTIDKYRNNQDILSALPMLEYTDGKLQGITNEFIVKLAAGTKLEQLKRLVSEKNCTIVKENQFVKNQFLISVSKTSSLNSLQLANLFSETGLFEFSEPNFFRENILQSNDPLFGNQWPLKNTGQNSGTSGADIKIEQAWTITQGRPEIHIAVVDEGVDITHPDLSPNLLTGFDATGNGTLGAALSGEYHGTACAGIIAAVKDNGIGITGVAPKCKILPVHVSFGSGQTDQWLADGLEWSWNPSFGNADVISNSWSGGSPVSAITNAINSAASQGRGGLGSVVLFSTGNNGNSSVNYPANLSNVIAVGATSVNDSKESYSNYGSDLDVVAPGGDVNIYSTDIVGASGYSTDDYTTSFDGTSAACPHAAGVAALILSVNRCLTGVQVKQILELSCDKSGTLCYGSGQPNGQWNNEMGYGRVNAHKAVQYAFSLQTTSFLDSPGTDIATTDDFQWILTGGGCSQLAAASYIVKRHDIRLGLSYGYTQAPIIIGTVNGISAANPNTGLYYFNVLNISSTAANVQTWVYEVISTISGQTVSWVPTAPTNIRFNLTVLSSLSTDLYFQNQNVTGTESHNAMNKIEAGKNVTSAVPVGDYVVQNGADVTFHAGNVIILSDGFVAEAGSNFNAFIDPFFTCTQYPMGRMANSDSITNTVIKDYEVELIEKTPMLL
jgi:subtilisin family serine protease